MDINKLQQSMVVPIQNKQNIDYILLSYCHMTSAVSNSHVDSSALVKSIISKMMYTCDNPYCKHRLTGCTCNYAYCGNAHYNCAGRTRIMPSRSQYTMSFGKNYDNTCQCIKASRNIMNPEESDLKNSRKSDHCTYSRAFCSCHAIPAGDYTSEQERGRWVNNSLHQGSRMKNIIYESQNPRARIQSGCFAKNYDTQYQIYENRVKRTKVQDPFPQVRGKSSILIRRDRDKEQRN